MIIVQEYDIKENVNGEVYLMNNLNVKMKTIKSIYMSMGNHTRGHYDFKCLLAKLFECEDIVTPYICS